VISAKKSIKRKLGVAIRDKAVSIATSEGRGLSGEELLDLLDKDYKKRTPGRPETANGGSDGT
jgi:hypothetical protein